MITKYGERFSEKIAHGPHRRTIAFSLVEVVLAIGIVSFAVLSIVSLLSVGMLSSRESQEDTILALATQQVAAWSRSQPYADLHAAAKAEDARVEEDPPNPILLYFNEKGVLARQSNGLPAAVEDADSHYLCTFQPLLSSISGDLLYLKFSFEWPLAAPESKRQKRFIVVSRSNEN